MKAGTALAAGACALTLVEVVQAAPAKKAPAPAAANTPPIATYWMDVSTQSGLGMGMMGGGRPDMGAIMSMMNGGGGSVSHTLNLRLASRTPAPGAPRADHIIPPGLGMGESLPLVSPQRIAPERGDMSYQHPRGRMLIYWGCGDHASAGQPLSFDFAQMASGNVPENVRRMAEMMGRRGVAARSGPTSAPGFGEWPNRDDSQAVPPGGSLVGRHRVEGNYSPSIAFTLASGQDFMGPMRMSDGGTAPSGAGLVRWNMVPAATGYALAMFGSNRGGDVIMWNSASSASFAMLDYLPPGEAARAVATGNALAPTTTQCLIPAEVVRSVPAGMVMGIAYGPELHFADAPRNPKWAVTVRYKSNGSLMRGMGRMGRMGPGMGDDGDDEN